MSRIYLCGFMGCGKTTIAKALSKAASLPCFDTDQLIVDRYKMPVSSIFSIHGEAYFRQIERETLLATGELENGIFATGGGILTNEANGELLRSLGTLIYLKTPFEICYRRIKGDQNRPIAVSKTKQELQELYFQRQERYERYSHYVLPAGDGVHRVVNQIMKLISE